MDWPRQVPLVRLCNGKFHEGWQRWSTVWNLCKHLICRIKQGGLFIVPNTHLKLSLYSIPPLTSCYLNLPLTQSVTSFPVSYFIILCANLIMRCINAQCCIISLILYSTRVFIIYFFCASLTGLGAFIFGCWEFDFNQTTFCWMVVLVGHMEFTIILFTVAWILTQGMLLYVLILYNYIIIISQQTFAKIL